MEQPRPLPAKYFRPPPRVDRVARPSLIRRLDDAENSRVVLVTASAGFGKTTLVSDWIEARQPAHSWLALNGTCDPPAFWRDLVTSVQAVCPGAGHIALDVLKSGDVSRVVECAALLAADLTEQTPVAPGRRCIIIDDYHLVPDEITQQSMATLAAALEPPWQLLIIARSLPAIPLARMRAAGQVTHIENTELSFSAAETREFIEKCSQLQLAEEDLATLHEKTEGWPAGLQLAALSLRRVNNPHAFIDGLSGDSRVIEDYLTEEVLRSLPGPLQQFLEMLAPLERFCAPLCDTLVAEVPALAGENPRKMLDTLERMNLFLVPLDDNQDWYRFHHLFRELLQRRSEPGQRRDVAMRTAANWLQDHGHIDDALALVLELGDPRWCERLLMQGAGLRQPFEVREWLRRLPESYVAQSPILIYTGTATAMQSGQPREAQYWLNMLTRLGSQRGRFAEDPQLNTELQCYALLADAWVEISKDDAASSSNAADEVAGLIETMPADAHSGRSRLALVHSELLFQAGRLEEACRSARDSIKDATAMRMGRILGGSYNRIGECCALQGRLHDLASIVAEGVRATMQTPASDQLTAMGYLEKLHCDLLIEQYSIAEARDKLLSLRERSQREAHHYLDLASGLLLATVLRCQQQHEHGLALAQQLVRISAEHIIRFWFMPSPQAVAARFNLESGNLSAAQQWANAAHLEADQALTHLREYDYLMLVRLLNAERRHKDAARLVGRIRRHAGDSGRHRIRLEALLLEAITARHLGRDALKPLSAALRLGAGEGYVRPFLDEGDLLRELLRDAAGAGIEPDHVDRIEALAQTQRGDESSILTPRELEVLRLAASGRANKQIAAQLKLSPNTIKTHTRNIYDKLGAANRMQAVARASVIGLL